MTLTQILQKIKSAFYTKSEIDASLSGYLPKSGGLMTGDMIGRDVDDSRLTLRGASSYTKGSYLALSGKDSDLGGIFRLVANDGISSVILSGLPNGTLTWGNKNLDVIEEQGDNYIRYSNGIQICWGEVQNTTNGYATRSFDKSFSGSKPKVMLCKLGTLAGEVAYDVSGSSVSVVKVHFFSGNGSVNTEATTKCHYIAIGKWK